MVSYNYDPKTGRFISPDDPKYLDFEVAYGTNLYAYCVNNPVMFGVVESYKSVESVYWSEKGSQVTFAMINDVIKISDMWIR